MSIRTKVSLSVLAAFAVLSAALILISQAVLLPSFEDLEQQAMQANLDRVGNALADRAAALSATAGDWSYWDDTYAFAEGEYETYADDNLYDDAIAVLGVNFVLLTDAEGEVIFAKGFDPDQYEEIAIPAELEAYARALPEAGDFAGDRLESDVRGLVQTSEGLVIVASRAILKNGPRGPAAGTFTFGRYVDAVEVAALSESLRLSTAIYGLAQDDLPDEIAAVAAQLGAEQPYHIDVMEDDQLAGYSLLADTGGEPAAIVRVEMPRDITRQGREVVSRLTFYLLATGLALMVVVLLALERTVIRRVASLSRGVARIQASGILTERVPVGGQDEVAALGRHINSLLDRLGASHQELTGKNQELETAYRQAQEAARLKTQFLSTISHELRTPMNAIIGYADIMNMGLSGELNEKHKSYVRRILDNGSRLLSLINDILDVGKIEAGQLILQSKPVSPSALVSRVHAQLKGLIDKKALDFASEIDPGLPPLLEGDPNRLEQVLVNLVGNAIKFTEQGKVTVRMQRSDPAQWQIEVLDTGVGIPPDALEYIFEEFRQVDSTMTRRFEGSGLGLAIVKKLVLLMGGKIRVESELKKGSTFTVTLPLKTAEAVKAEVTP